MKGSRRVLVDVDGVLADFTPVAVQAIETVTGKPFAREGRNEWDLFAGLTREQDSAVWQLIGQPGVVARMELLPGARDLMGALRDLAEEVYVVTSAPDLPHWHKERLWWLWEHLQVPRKKVVFASEKHIIRADAIIDDRPATVERWLEEHSAGLGILYACLETEAYILPPGAVRVNTWLEAARELELHLWRTL